jgi:phosphopantothenoylcysteine decarboxylase/phosphopantothenate--cysteine ligase
MTAPRILLIIGGGIAAYKACELVRLIRKGGGDVTCVLTEGGAKFVTAMSLAALSENPVHTTLWDLKNEVEMGHIQLSRQADLVVVCPATANLLAKMSAGIADDLATTLLLATDKPVLTVPAMNVKMWQHPATVANVEALRMAGVEVMDPDEGAMACGEFGPGRLPEPVAVWHRIAALLGVDPGETFVPTLEWLEAGDYTESEDTGLGGLSASLVIRKAPDEPFEFEELPEGEAPPLEPEPAVPLDLAGPILARKGKAKSAPPTDPDAINHLVAPDRQSAPEPIPGDSFTPLAAGAAPAAPADPYPGLPYAGVPMEQRPLYGKRVLITAGPTHEPIDPVRYIANRSSGKQGFAIAANAAAFGAKVTLIAGPVNLPTPAGVERIDVETARDMAEAVKKALPADAAVMVAAVADWRTKDVAHEKIKKRGSAPPALLLTENPDILATTAAGRSRPKLLIGFAAETENVVANATEKRKRKGVDWIVANDVSGDVMGGDDNTVHIVTPEGVEDLVKLPKGEVARVLVERIAHALAG